jgi:tellurite resistance protein TehA-like permease
MFWLLSKQVAQRDIMNSIDREMSGDLKSGFKCIGMICFVHYTAISINVVILVVNSSYRLNFDQDKKNEIQHYS